MGAGSDGDISIKPEDIDFGTITVGYSNVMMITVNNKSHTNIFVEFCLE